MARRLSRVGITQDDKHQRGAREIVRRMVFNSLVNYTDGHKQNHAVRVVNPFDHGRLKLANARGCDSAGEAKKPSPICRKLSLTPWALGCRRSVCTKW